MLQLVYMSYEVQPLSDQEMLDLLDQARAFNQSQDITGMLLYKGGVFLQLLEGEEHQVRSLYERIGRDPRHDRLEVLVENSDAEERLFPHWTMAFQRVETFEEALMKEFLTWFQQVDDGTLEKADNATILGLLKKFRFALGKKEKKAS